MRILFICGAGTLFGKEVITLSLIDGLRKRGHEVMCLTSTWADIEFIKRLERNSIPYACLPLGFISKSLNPSAIKMTLHQGLKLARLWRGYKKILRDFKPDAIIHTTFHHVVLLYPFLNSRTDFFHVHDPFQPSGFYKRLFNFLNQKLAALIGVSEFIRQSIIDLGVPAEKVFAVLNGIEGKPLVEGEASRKESPAQTKVNENSSDKIVRIGIVGQVGEWKGHDDFVEAARRLKESNLPFVCSIYGRGDADYVKSLKAKILRYELAQHVSWAGFIANTEEIFKRTDICVVPSRSQDPCPTVAIEAAHFGVPLIATKRGGLPELVRDGQTGYLVDAERPEQITEKLKLLIADKQLRQRMSEAARLHGLKNLTRDRMVNEMEAILIRSASEGRVQ